MPELPEVENFRRLLLPLKSDEHPLVLERCSLEKVPPRKFITDEEINDIKKSCLFVKNVLRKGKLICMVLQGGKPTQESKQKQKPVEKYLFLHMGMTGRISTPHNIPKLQELSDTDIYPPPCTYLRLSAGSNQACFSDPRKFGAIYLKDSMRQDFDVLAPDAWTSTRQIKMETTNREDGGRQVGDNDSTIVDIVTNLAQQSMGIKGVLLDQKRAICGVGNWVADEVLYQTKMHPDQNFLSREEAESLLRRLHFILGEAVNCLDKNQDFPEKWLFHYRWSKRSKSEVKDAHGRSIAFVTSGGRTSAIVPSIQKKGSRKVATAKTHTARNTENRTSRKISKTRSTPTKVPTSPEIVVPKRIARNKEKKNKTIKKRSTSTVGSASPDMVVSEHIAKRTRSATKLK